MRPDRWTKFFTAVLLLLAVAAHANPLPLELPVEPKTGFTPVEYWALFTESVLVTLMLLPAGVRFMPTFFTLVIANQIVFLLAFLPLIGSAPAWYLELGVVIVDAVIIKHAASAQYLQGPKFLGVSWTHASAVSFLGNAASYFISIYAGATATDFGPKSLDVLPGFR